jgi:hypothetical protein
MTTAWMATARTMVVTKILTRRRGKTIRPAGMRMRKKKQTSMKPQASLREVNSDAKAVIPHFFLEIVSPYFCNSIGSL